MLGFAYHVPTIPNTVRYPSPRRPAACFASFVIAALGTSCSSAGARVAATSSSAPVVDASASSSLPHGPVDYLVLVPRAFEHDIAPLVQLRAQEGHGVLIRVAEDVYAKRSHVAHEEALLAEVRDVAHANTSLRFLLLAGDPRGEGAALATFHKRLGPWVGDEAGTDLDYATDQPYALFSDGAAGHPLAVGRLPARTPTELDGMVSKIVAYETDPPTAWSRRVLVFAGPANFGESADRAVETFATSMLDGEVPHDFDLGVLYAQVSSPYAFRFDRLGAEMAHEMGSGALLAVFAGHGSPEAFDSVSFKRHAYPIGTVSDFAAIDGARGFPIFIALTCSAGAFDAPRRSIAETAMVNPHGPIASFAASAFSGAYVNMLYSQQLLDAFLSSRAPTVGEAIVMAKTKLGGTSSLSLTLVKAVMGGDGKGDMATSDEAIAEHLFIYNLFGDPATRPRYPERADVTLASSSIGPGAPFVATLTLPHGGFDDADVTIETERTQLKKGIVPGEQITALDAGPAFDTMEKNHAIAIDKVVSHTPVTVDSGTVRVELVGPSEPGSYWVRVIASGGGHVAAGAAHLSVRDK